MDYLEATNYLNSLEKEAGVLGATVAGAKTFGKGLWNMAFGGKTLSGKWDPFYGVNRLGKVQQVHPGGRGAEHLKGLRMSDPKTGEPVFEKGRNVLKFLKQEFGGTRPSKADWWASTQAKHMPVGKQAYKEGLKSGKYKAPGSRDWLGRPVQHPTGVNTGEYMQRMGKPDIQMMNEIRNMGMLEFAKKYPGVASKYVGANALHKGFLLGLPAYEAYDILANKEGVDPTKGVGANMGATIGSGLGWLGAMPLGWVGAPLAADALSRAGKHIGGKVDQWMGNKPLQQRKAPQALSQQQLAQQMTHGVVKQAPHAFSQIGSAAMSPSPLNPIR